MVKENFLNFEGSALTSFKKFAVALVSELPFSLASFLIWTFE
jgi:hypothetical protein